MYLCFDYVRSGTGKECTHYKLTFNLEEHILKIHTFILRTGEKPVHKDTFLNISAKEAEMLRNMNTEEERLRYIIMHQSKWCA